MMQKKLVLVLSVMIAFLAISCNSQFKGYDKTSSGAYYKFFVKTDSLLPEVGDVLTLGMSYKVGDSMLFNSNENPQAFQLLLQEPQYAGDIYECIAMMAKGDSAEFAIKADSFFYITAGAPSLPSYVDSSSYIYFNITMKKFQTREEADMEKAAELELIRSKEPGLIEDYIKTNNITIQPDEEGLYFIQTKKGTGKKVTNGSIILINYTLKFTTGDTLFTTYTTGELIDFEYGTQFDTKGFNKAIGQMRKGEKATFIVPSSLAFGAEGAGDQLGPFTPLVYDIEIVDIKDKALFQKEKAAKEEAQNAKLSGEEQTAIQKYLGDNKYDVSPTESGLYFIETLVGTGEIPISGDNVKVHYTLTTLNNDTIDSSVTRNEPLEFTVDKPGIIQGWHEAIKLMRVGGKAIWLIPSKLAYGPEGRLPMIQPFTPLLFEVEFLERVK